MALIKIFTTTCSMCRLIVINNSWGQHLNIYPTFRETISMCWGLLVSVEWRHVLTHIEANSFPLANIRYLFFESFECSTLHRVAFRVFSTMTSIFSFFLYIILQTKQNSSRALFIIIFLHLNECLRVAEIRRNVSCGSFFYCNSFFSIYPLILFFNLFPIYIYI